MTSIIIYKF